MLSLNARQTVVLVLVFILISGSLIALDSQHKLNDVRSPADQIVGPLSTSFSRIEHSITSFGHGDQSQLEKQLAAVTAERDQLLAENARLQQLQQQVDQLRQQLGFKQANPTLKLVTANVIGHDPEGAQQYVVLDRGSNDGIQLGMAVVSPNFFVGQVTEVEPNRSRVTLAIDSSYQVAARLQSAGTGAGGDGIVFGRWQSGGWMEMRFLDPTTKVQNGAIVVTSNKTAHVPAGLVIGKVYQVTRNVQADTLTLEVAPLVDLTRLSTLTVVLGSNSP